MKQDGPDTALEEVYEQVLPKLPRFSGLSREDREDAVHDACVRVLNTPPRTPLRNPLWYLLRAARNVLIDRHRARLRSEAHSAADVPWQDSGATLIDPERILSDRERLEVIRVAIEKLPPRCAEALRLHRFSGLSYPMIAQRMRISCSMVEKHIAEALRRLGQALDEADGGAPGCDRMASSERAKKNDTRF